MRFAIALLAALALACGGDGATGPTAASVTGIVGDSQVAPTGAPLAFPLSFVVLGSSGQPMQGVSVSWTVSPAGRAAFSPQTSASNALGEVATNVTVGATPGDVVIQANVPGVQPVVFHALVLDPCAYAASYTIGDTRTGVLTTNDCHVGGSYYTDYYQFTVGAQQGIAATMTATTFDAWLDAFRARQIAFNDDAGAGTSNARLQLIVAPGTYVLAPNTYSPNVTGAYTLTSGVRAQTLAGCAEETWVTRGVTITDGLTASDCPDTVAAGVFYSDLVGMIGFAGDTIKLTQRSAVFDPMLTLFRIDSIGLVVVASNDDSIPTTTDAFVSYPVMRTAVYVVSMSSADPAATGAYTIAVGGFPIGPSGPRPVAAAGTIRAGQSFARPRLPRKR